MAEIAKLVVPQLSVIVPVLNEAVGIVASLTALQPLRALGAEIILVDGGSTDGTIALAASLVDRQISCTRGRATQMNAGAAAARGEIFVFLHADTSLPQDAFALMIDGLAASSKVWGRFDVRIDGEPWMLRVIATMMNWRSRLTGIATGDQAIFVRKADFMKVGSFPELALMEDIALSRNLGRRTAPLCLRQKVTTSGRRWSNGGVWHTIILMWRLRLLYWLGVPAEQLIKKYK